jgi:hypothetical protein
MLNMNAQLHETTLSLVSLINFYSQFNRDNEKIKYAIGSSQSLILQKIEASSEKSKLQFCSDAVEAIASVVIESKAKNSKVKNFGPILNKEEINFIQGLTFNGVCHNVECKTDETDYES